ASTLFPYTTLFRSVVRVPSLFSITFAWLPSNTATQEFVVPKSIPIILDIYVSPHTRHEPHKAAHAAESICIPIWRRLLIFQGLHLNFLLALGYYHTCWAQQAFV